MKDATTTNFWLRAFRQAGGFGLILGLYQVLLMKVLGMSLARSLWTTSVTIFLSIVTGLAIYIHRTAHAGDQEEKLETELYKKIEENIVVGGADASSIIARDSRMENKGHIQQ